MAEFVLHLRLDNLSDNIEIMFETCCSLETFE
ncbi:hypothetical protein Tpau_4128 [Tsukamurella paurometabola DSM 20162]|uniref:Uncharacterized protein n=1 Tax=Tsukamurella paurometabola (strain ATCC 8368 / DSM 20162 / CCUG 35730 / CIP 100753 / JCM 10117 / KCTC 9821 / NBRC 16120 / NCIMB 702349 / NCTC 13040) TaxID=521096 RepID=D5UNY8_TSUPD|nr:hypothetical protein Tpau_4128 [Tsukamurella paurometabola DSM 20162]